MRRLIQVNARLFEEDVETIKARAAESGLPWQVELRMLVHRAVKETQMKILDVDPRRVRKASK